MPDTEEPLQFRICRKCHCLSFDRDEIERRYCNICKKTLAESEYFASDPAEGENGLAKTFKAYIASRG